MRILFFDMEFADGKVAGSIFSFGYLITDEEFAILEQPRDLLINPESTWNEYVVEHILAYPMEEIQAAPSFLSRYEELREIFAGVDFVVGFSISNDNRALRKDCERYALPKLLYKYFDVEKLCRMMGEHKEAHGLGGYYTAWCGGEAANAHRSDGDAYATMALLRAICQKNHVDAQMMIEAYPECVGETKEEAPPKEKKNSGHKRGSKRRRRRPARRSAGDQTETTAEQNTERSSV